MKNTYLLLFFFLFSVALPAKEYVLVSPDGKLKTTISVGGRIEYEISYNGDRILEKSPLSMTLTDGKRFGIHSRLSKVISETVDETITSPVYKRSKVRNHCHELTFLFKENFKLVFRAYNEGVAYRFIVTGKKPFEVQKEEVCFNFPTDQKAYIPYVQNQRNSLDEQMYTSFENTYEHINLSQWNKKRLAFSPLVVESDNGKKVCLAESDLLDYAGMFLYKGDGNSIIGLFSNHPKEIFLGGENKTQLMVKSKEAYIAKYNSGTTFPWRIIGVIENDTQLADNDLVYKLASPEKEGLDFSWVQPGKSIWDWWHGNSLRGVDFVAGMNTETYKYYIDFAAANHTEYVILDGGWSSLSNLYETRKGLDLEELVRYGKEKNVGLIIWAMGPLFSLKAEEYCRHFSGLGIKGFKLDYFDRDDQEMVAIHRQIAETAAKYKLLIDFHGTYKPTGLTRTYPNVLNYEGVRGLEYMKWSSNETDQVTYDVTIPFIRMFAGPMDYTQGAMRNARKGNFRPIFTEAMSQGTRCRQLAEYVVFESPLSMWCDSPSNYLKEPECSGFIASVPTVWDETIALNGEIAKYITIARKKGDQWFLGSMTNWDERELTLDLSFLGGGAYKAEVFKDGLNANKVASDYKKEIIDIPAGRKLTIRMASGGGYAARIYK